MNIKKLILFGWFFFWVQMSPFGTTSEIVGPFRSEGECGAIRSQLHDNGPATFWTGMPTEFLNNWKEQFAADYKSIIFQRMSACWTDEKVPVPTPVTVQGILIEKKKKTSSWDSSEQ
jgi:hypothetical protein